MYKKIIRLRRSVTVLGGLLFTVLGVIAAAPSAFAVRLVDPPDGSASALPAVTVIRGGGMLGWQIVLIAVGAAVAASVVTVFALRSRRPVASQLAA